jgi:hypothetical protein
VGDEDADDNDHVMMDDAFGCEDENDDKTDAPQVDEECDVDMEEIVNTKNLYRMEFDLWA